MRSRQRPHRRHQDGSATLLVGLLLLVGAGILTVSATRTSVTEQRIANNESRAMEAEEAARAGLDFAAAWLSRNVGASGTLAITAPDVPSDTGDTYATGVTLSASNAVTCATATTNARLDADITATQHECFLQRGLFDPRTGSGMPPPLALAGCLSTPTASADVMVAGTGSAAAASGTGATAACLPAGTISTSLWGDSNGNGQLDLSEIGSATSFQRASFPGCPAAHCAWNRYFAMEFDEAKRLAAAAGHSYPARLPCGPTAAPGIYLIEQSGSIGIWDFTGSCLGTEGIDNATIGTPSQPILLIVPKERGCPSFQSGVTIHGIVYYESTTACAGVGWGGANVYGSVIWEGSAGGPAAGSTFIETDYGPIDRLNEVFKTVSDAAPVPGTWRDWN